ncbi:rho GTPase-activating protein 19-like isoform X1 [Biomphalaria glabrata]|uniref:Rho-GAP domain-containing protein n=2 Tax=Biomphalaria glabrata TaxID=6526 RepID=A0A2C9M6X1_BIOGL|nr:rho GTPase-activating protein 19-like isoform X1 [Biomphalaria glabrata]
MDHGPDLLMLEKMDVLTQRQLQYLEDKYVTRTMKCVPEKFLEMCHMHLAFLLDLSGDKLELLLSDYEHDSDKKKKLGLTNVAVFKRKSDKNNGLFGSPLTDEGVCLMLPLIKFLKMESNVCKEGLFRKPGNCVRMNTLRELLISQGPSVMIDPQVYTPYDVAGVLKEFLRELPEPLLTDRHMEAHRQIIDLGKHARTPEDKERYNKKKLSALQLLMLLMPSPSQKMTLHLVRLLQRVADCVETKMTPATLGTIFAPIFFLNRKVGASEVCSIVSLTEPAVAFMIENAHELFQAPKELVIDLANYWNRLEKSSPSAECETSSDPHQIKKSVSGRTLVTNVCYLDRERSRCDDVASNTQNELQNLFAHVQSLPDTPHNIRLKSKILKATTTPTSSTKKHKRSKSISASIKKRFPSIGRSKSRNPEMSRLSTSSATSCSSNDEPKDYSHTGSDKVAVVHCSYNKLHSQRKRLDFNSLCFTNSGPVLSDLLMSPTSSKPTGDTRLSRPRHKRGNTMNTPADCSPPKQECLEHSPYSSSQKENLPENVSLQATNIANAFKENICLSSTKINSENSSPAIQNLSPRLKPLPLSLSNSFSPKYIFSQSENEINYLPSFPINTVKAPLTPSNGQLKFSRKELKSCKVPGTPIMPRCLLHMAQSNNTLETSI